MSYFSQEEVFKIMQNIGISEAGIDNLPGKLLKDGAEIITKT